MAKRKANDPVPPYSLYGDSAADESGWLLYGHYATAVEADKIARAKIKARAWSRAELRDMNGKVILEYPDYVRRSWRDWMVERCAPVCEEYPGQKEARLERAKREGEAT